jgi:hypothetical protein
MTAPVATVVFPVIAVPGIKMTSDSTVAVASTHVLSGSTMVTPSRIKSSLMRSRKSAADSAS